MPWVTLLLLEMEEKRKERGGEQATRRRKGELVQKKDSVLVMTTFQLFVAQSQQEISFRIFRLVHVLCIRGNCSRDVGPFCVLVVIQSFADIISARKPTLLRL